MPGDGLSEMDAMSVAIVIGLLFTALIVTFLKLELILKSLASSADKSERIRY